LCYNDFILTKTKMNPVSAVPAHNPTPPAASDGLTPNIVSNIPIHNQGGVPVAPAANEDAELDKIMRDVNHELKKGEKTPERHHFSFERRHHKKNEAKFSAQPRAIIDVKAQPAETPKPTAEHTSTPAPTAQTKPAGRPRPTPVPKPAKTSSAPVMVILLTVIVTGGLIAVAIYAYK
jgi:hypothetical protein